MTEESPKVEMLRSVKGKDMLLVGDFLYHYDDRTSKAYRWVCSRRKDKTPCRVRMYTTLIDEWDLTRHKLESIVGEHPHGPAEPEAIARAREKKRQADAEGLPCTLSNKSMKRRYQQQELVKQINAKRQKMYGDVGDHEDDENNTSRDNVDTSDDELGDLVQSLGIKPPRNEAKKPEEKKVIMLKTAKGHHLVAVDGCVYRLDGKSLISTTYRWKCFRSKDLQCSGKIYTECLANGQHRFRPIRLEENTHNHQPYSDQKIEALIRRNNIKVLQGKDEKASFKAFEKLTPSPDKKSFIKTEKKNLPKSIPLSVTKGGGNVLSISTDIDLAPKPDARRIRAEITSKLYRQVDDVMDALENPTDEEITKFTFLPSLKGNRILIMNNMIFHYDSRGSRCDRAYWTCLYRRDKTFKCNSRLTTEGDGKDMKIIKVSGEHKHAANHREHILKRINQNLKVKKESMLVSKMEMFSSSEDDEDDANDDDYFGTQDTTVQERTLSRENSPDINDFLHMKKPKAEQEMETTVEMVEAPLEENAQATIMNYKNETEVDPFHETLPIIEYVEMERLNTSNFRSDSEAELEYKPRPTKSRRSAANEADDENDEDYSPQQSKIRKPQSLLKRYTRHTPTASFNPDNIDVTKTTKLRSAKGGELLCVDGYIYHLKSISPTTRTYWACIKSKDRLMKCPARVTTVSDECNQLRVVHLSNSHTHPVSEYDIKKRLFNEFSKTAVKSDIKTKHIMEKSLSELNPEFAYLLRENKAVKEESFRFNMKLYSVSDGPPSLAVRMCLKALDIPYELHNVDYIASEHLSEEYAKLNPQKEIPVLDDDGFYLSESIAIMQYLCDKYAGEKTVLYPKDPKERALVNHRLCFNMSFYYSSIGAYSMAPIFFDYERTELGLKKVKNALSVFETYLERLGKKYAAGNNVSIADFALVSATLCLEAISFDLSPYPRITTWYNTFKKEHPDLWSIANAGMLEIKEFEHNRPDLSHMNHPFHPTRKHNK
ncbi:GST-containing FLYWCH zinc-finger protein [Cochliomyia hominivorax]